MAKHKTMRTEISDGVATIFPDRPEKKNALSTELFEDLTKTLQAWRRDNNVAVVVITGNETFFSAGLDLDTMNWKTDADRLRWYDATYYGHVQYRDVHWNPAISQRMLSARQKIGTRAG